MSLILFDIFELDRKSNKKSLYLISNYIFNRFGFNNIINYSMFENWSTKISNGYNRENPYHTDLHAGDITQSCLVYFKSGKINKICKLNQLSKCALFLSCICHDYKHPGVNNNFLKDTRNSLAIKYNDTSILENMHISESFKLTIDNPDCNIFSGLNSENYNKLRKEIKDFLKEQLKGTEPDNPKEIDLSIEINRGPDNSMLLMKMNITALFYDEEFDSVGFYEKDEDMPHELDYLNIDEQLEIVNVLCNE